MVLWAYSDEAGHGPCPDGWRRMEAMSLTQEHVQNLSLVVERKGEPIPVIKIDLMCLISLIEYKVRKGET